MKKLMSLTICIMLSMMSFAQETFENHFTDSVEAQTYAKTYETNILMVFSGSDWCRPCIQFKKDILMHESFQEFAKENIAILYLDFPSKKKNKLSKEQMEHNESLAEQYNKSGAFPHIVLMSPDMQKLKDLKFTGQSAEEFIEEINE